FPIGCRLGLDQDRAQACENLRPRRILYTGILMVHAKKAMVTGSGGLIGSECVRLLSSDGWQVIGLDNDMRRQFFGPLGTTEPVVEELKNQFPGYHHYNVDIRDRQTVRDVLARERPDFIIHTAAQPSHDKAASIAY